MMISQAYQGHHQNRARCISSQGWRLTQTPLYYYEILPVKSCIVSAYSKNNTIVRFTLSLSARWNFCFFIFCFSKICPILIVRLPSVTAQAKCDLARLPCSKADTPVAARFDFGHFDFDLTQTCLHSVQALSPPLPRQRRSLWMQQLQ